MGPASGVGRGGLLAAALVAAFALAACGLEPVGDHDGLVCSRCLPQERQSPDAWWLFGCALAPAPLTDAVAREFDVEQQRELARGSFSATFRWVFDPSTSTPAPPPPTGYQRTTTVDGSLSLGEPVYYDHAPVTDLSVECQREVDVPAVVTLSTADGAIGTTTTSGTMRLIEGSLPGAWSVTGYRDLAGVPGNLNLRLDVTGIQRGTLYVELIASPQGLRGMIAPVGVRFASREEADQYYPLDDQLFGQRADSLRGRWPDDLCSYDRIPIDASAPQPWLAGDSFEQALAKLPVGAAAARPQPGRWFKGADVEVSVELGTPSGICMSSNGPDVDFTFDTTGVISTSDGRVHVGLPSGYLGLIKTTGVGGSMFTLGMTTAQLSPASFPAMVGIKGVDAAGSPWMSADLGARFAWEPDGAVSAQGAIEVWGAPPCGAPGVACGPLYHTGDTSGLACLSWPRTAVFPTSCGVHLR